MYGAWWIGDTSRTADTLVLYKNSLRLACVHCECLRLAHSPMWSGGGGTDTGVTAGRWMVRGCCHVAVDWMGLWGEEHLCSCPVAMWGRGREENLPVWHPNRGSGFFITHSLRSWVKTSLRAGLIALQVFVPFDPDAPGHCMTGAFLVFFGAATKCAMCYVAWFIIFLQATKLICSPIV